MRGQQWHRIARRTAVQVRQAQLDFLAAAVTYYALLSFVPLTGLLFLFLGSITDTGVAASAATLIGQVLPPTAEDALLTVVSSRSAAGATIASIGIFAWGAFHLFRALDIAFHRIYYGDEAPSLRHQLHHAAAALIALALAAGVTVLAGALIAVSATVPFAGVVWTGVQFAALAAVFTALYTVFGHPHRWDQLLPGAVVAAAGWTVLQTVFTVYTQAVGGSLYAAFGGVLLFVIWLYLAAYTVLLGAVVNVAYREVVHGEDWE